MNNWSKVNFIFLATLLVTILASSDSDDVAKAFIEYKIVPDLLSQPPKKLLKVTYPCSVVVNKGNELTPTQVKSQPDLEWRSSPNFYYTLMMLDLDAPSRAEPTFRAVKHWLVTNIPGNKVNNGEVLAAFFGSGPQLNTGLHRYVLLIYKQPRKLVFDEIRVGNNSIEGRLNFKPEAFARKYQLKGSIAGNFYQAQWDPYVPTILAQIGLT